MVYLRRAGVVMQAGMIGLGRMGANMARRLILAGHEIVVYDRDKNIIKELAKEGAKASGSVKDLIKKLKKPRVVWLMLPAGKITETTLKETIGLLSKGDILVEGGNSYYKDDIIRFEKCKKRGINYLDAGVSGGVWGLKKGYVTMIGGDKKVFDTVEPLIRSLAPENGYMYCGGPGAGHFVKMTHNAIEYGLMEAYAEGFELLKASAYGKQLDPARVAGIWNTSSIVKSWLLEMIIDIFKDPGELDSLQGYVEDSGETRWAVKEAADTGVALDAITSSLYKRFNSRQQDVYANKLIAAMRREFGGHMAAKAGVKVKNNSTGAGAVRHARPERKNI